jgi:alcohol dehydrogenase class IV
VSIKYVPCSIGGGGQVEETRGKAKIVTQFSYAGHAQDIVFESGAARELERILSPYSWKRYLILTSGSHVRSGNADRVQSALGNRVAALFDTVKPHVQIEQVEDVLGLALAHDVDVTLALGGGSVIGMAKATSDRLHEARTGVLARNAHPLEGPSVPTIMLPTTYAGSEMTSVYGVTGPVDGVRRKMTVSGRNIVPRVVVYDPELTVGMPAELTGTSAMNALAHCFEALYSAKRDPLSSAAALGGIRSIGLSLATACRNGSDVGARSDLLEGAFLAGSALAQVQMGIHHGVCHVLGGSAGVPHGVANTIVLPHALRFNRVAAKSELAEAAISMDLATRRDDRQVAADRVIDWIDGLSNELGLPKRLSEQGVDERQIPDLARIVMDGAPVKANPRRVESQQEMEQFLQRMM